MANKVFYIKPNQNGFSEAIKDGILKALSVLATENFSNIKLVLSHSDLLTSTPNHLSGAFDIFFTGKGENVVKELNKNRCFSLIDVPSEGINTGIEVMLINHISFLAGQKTIVVLYNANYDSLISVKSKLFGLEYDLVAISEYETDELNEVLSAIKGENISNIPDINVTPYVNSFTQEENNILRPLKSINITSHATHTPTLSTMNRVIEDLQKSHIKISYERFLGYLCNDVGYKLSDCISLMSRQIKYFDR